MKIFLSFILALFGFSLAAQTIIDLEIDSIHCQQGNCFLLNIGEENNYSCEIQSSYVNDDLYNFYLECDEETSILADSNHLAINRLTSLTEFNQWITQNNFISKADENQDHTRIGILSNNYAIVSKGKINSRNVWDHIYEIFPIRINREYFIAGLMEAEGEDYFDYLIVPDKKEVKVIDPYKMEFKISNFEQDIDEDIKDEILETYKIRKSANGYILTNSISRRQVLEGFYDEISKPFNFLITRKNDDYKIYDFLLRTHDFGNVSYVGGNYNSLDLIIDDERKWLTSDGTLVDTFPYKELMIGCGNITTFPKEIIWDSGHYYEIVTQLDAFSNNEVNKDTFSFDLPDDIIDIKYLSDSTAHVFGTEKYAYYYNYEFELYYFKRKNGKEGFFRRYTTKDEIIQAVRKSTSIPIKLKRDSVAYILDGVPLVYKNEILFEGHFDRIELSGYHAPVRFEKNNLFGFYPQMEDGKYAQLDDFKGSLASFTTVTGEEGWIDLEGNEYFKKK